MTIWPRKFGLAAVVGIIAALSLLLVAGTLYRQGQATLGLIILGSVIVLSIAILGVAHVVGEIIRLPSDLIQAGGDALRGAFDWLGGILKPKVEIRSAILAGIRRFDSQGKLVVGSLRVDVMSQIVETSALGTILGQAMARDVGVQYFIPLDGITVENFQWSFTVDRDSGERGIAVGCSLPSPQVDEEFVAIDEQLVETLSLGSGIQTINPWSGKHALVAKARAELKPRAFEIAQRPECLLAAERMARTHLEDLVQSVVSSLLQLSHGKAPPIAVLVRFTPALTRTQVTEQSLPGSQSASE